MKLSTLRLNCIFEFSLPLFNQTKDSEKTGSDQTKICSLSVWQEKHEQSRGYAYGYKVFAKVKGKCTWEAIKHRD